MTYRCECEDSQYKETCSQECDCCSFGAVVTKVISKRQSTGHVDEVYIGRPSIFGNPYAVGNRCQRCGEVHRVASSTLPCYVAYFNDRICSDPAFMDAVLALKGKTLVCWCKPAPCHGDVIAEWLDNQ